MLLLSPRATSGHSAVTMTMRQVLVSFAPLLEEARERIIDGKTVADHEAEGKVRIMIRSIALIDRARLYLGVS